MPQYLKIEVAGKLVGFLSTGNKGGTLYDVTLDVPELEAENALSDVDTGVHRQPQDAEARDKDYRDDFIHARRCIAAAVACAEYFLQQLREQAPPECAEMRPITMRLMTNACDRGLIQVHPSDDDSVNVDVIIGFGACRVPDAFPNDEYHLSWEGIDAPGATSQTARALMILRSIGPTLLEALKEQAAPETD